MFRRAGIDATDGPTRLADLLEEVPPGDPDIPGIDEDAAGSRPAFRIRMHGYDRLEVDNHVARTEWELLSARRHAVHLLDRLGACSAELEIARRQLAETPRERRVSTVSERLVEILRLAAEEAGEMIDAAGKEADRLLAEARAEADARLAKVQAIEQRAAVADAEQQVRAARLERDRLDAEAVAAEQRTRAAEARLAAVEEELVDLQRQRDEARSSLRRLTDQIDRALHAVDPADLVATTS
jgi:chromosome segregation ATPase